MAPIMMEVIEWFDQTGTGIVHRYPEGGSGDIKMGAQLVVRENQAAVFFRDGQGLDVFGPGRHTLSTQNLPILTRLLSLPWGFTSPFRAEVYFANLKVFTNMRWGTRDPVAFKDTQLGLIRLRAFGNFTMRVAQPLLFVNSLVGTQGSYTTDQIEDYLRDVIVARLNDFLGEKVQSLLDLPPHYDEMAVALKTRLVDEFRKYGAELVDFYINRITPPEEVERMIDERSGMGAVGDLDRFLKFKAAKAMGDAAQGGGGGVGNGAAAGVGVGVGAGLGMMMPGMLAKSLGAEPAAAPASGIITCPGCQGAVASDSRFCPRCGRQLAATARCSRCQAELPGGARFCASCGQAVPGS
jgi:membrane protease subunit (stomatin/prohibitin family)